MRQPCVAGNWKMHKSVAEATELIQELVPGLNKLESVTSIVCPPFTALAPAAELLKGSSIHLGAQNLYWEGQGAFTGEISPGMVAELVEYVILGHSERRAMFQDSDEWVNKKILAALEAGLNVIFCVGETLEENEGGMTGKVVSDQIKKGLGGVTSAQLDRIMVAYEPVWAIGTGLAATPADANQIISEHIRDVLAKIYSESAAEGIPILYGGSVKPGNAREFFQQSDIDGALVGGASLKAADFIAISEAAA